MTLLQRYDDAIYKLGLWERAGDAIMETAFGRKAPLSDSDVCGLIIEQRTENAELKAKIAKLEARLEDRG